MRQRFVLLAAAMLFASSLPTPWLSAQQQQQQSPREPDRSQQVGVPAGRQGGEGRGVQGVVGGLDQPAKEPPRPAPRGPHGRVLLGGATPEDKGVWLPGRGAFAAFAETDAVPFQPWAKALYADRRENQLEPHTRCKPSGTVRQFLTPYGVEFVEFPDLQRIYIFDIGGPHTYRTVYMDGRTHPKNLTPSYYGHSIGWWDGDTLIIESTGFNESFWMDRQGLPHTEKLRTLERFTRTDAATIKYELTVDDPGAYTKTWKSGMDLRWEKGTELFEYVCQQGNYAHELMLGAHESVDRSSPIVP
jgi:hypothetical protein